MSATEKPVTELTPKTSTSALSGNAVVIYNKTTGDADSLDGDSLKTLLDDADTAYQLPQTGIPRTDLSQDIKDELDSKASRDTDAVEGELAEFDANGNPVDSGIATGSVMLKDVSAGEGDLAVFDDEGGVIPGFNVDEVMRKTVGTVEGNLAEFNADGNPVDSGVPTSKIGEIEEGLSVLRNSAGIAEGIADTISAGTPQEFVFRQSGGDGVNYMKRIKGKSIVWNQLFEHGNFDSLDGWIAGAGGNLSISDNILTIEPAANGERVSRNVNLVAGHKYLLSLYAKVNNNINFSLREGNDQGFAFFTIIGNGQWQEVSAIYTAVNTALSWMGFSEYNTEEYQVRNVMLIDLTLLGLGDITIEQFRALYPDSYYPYNAGSVESNDAEALESVGRNLWDEECGYNKKWNDDTGVLESSSGRLYNLNPIPVVAGATYYAKVGGNGYIYPHFYDGAMNYLGRGTTSEIRNQTFTVPTEACYMNFHTYNYNGTYNHDICINLSDASFNGQYEPYWKRRIELNLSTLKDVDGNLVFPYGGMHGTGTAFDSMKPEADGFIHYANRVYGRVNLGDFGWTSNGYGAYYATIPGKAIGGVYSNNSVLAEYGYDHRVFTNTSAAPDRTFSNGDNNNLIYIKDARFTDAATAKSILSGVYLYFVLATPAVVELAEPIPNAVLVDSYGTEKAIFPEHEDGTPSAPFACDSNYSISVKNLVAIINSLNTE